MMTMALHLKKAAKLSNNWGPPLSMGVLLTFICFTFHLCLSGSLAYSKEIDLSFYEFAGLPSNNELKINRLNGYIKEYNSLPDVLSKIVTVFRGSYRNGCDFNTYLIAGNSRTKRLIIYNPGHDKDIFNSSYPHHKSFIELALTKGDLLLSAMPLIGQNDPILNNCFATLWHSKKIRVLTSNHAFFELLQTKQHWAHYFVDPVIFPLRLIAGDYEQIEYVGFSGGGWTGLVLASFPNPVTHYTIIAGFLPEEARLTNNNIGDMEQFSSSIYVRFPYRYFISNLEKRGATIIYNSNDTCCFDAASNMHVIQLLIKEFKGIKFIIRKSNIHDFSPNEILR